MTDIARAKSIADWDFVGGQRLPDDNAGFQTGLAFHVFLCGGCNAKHLAITTITGGRRRTVTIHGDDARTFVDKLSQAMANG